MDPTTEVALALHSAPGVYAALLGSGVSRGAGIPTGWEVTLDLIKRLGVATDGEAPDDPAAWYVGRHGDDPDYSRVLEQLAPNPAERQALLRSYFEPTDEERADGLKQPIGAHHALAELTRRGVIRVVLTTNFDPLIEQALNGAGVPHDTWHSPDAIRGGVPLTHGRVVVVKLNGDYRDTRILNTLAELQTYDDAVDELLDRVLDEFGLIVCGWSGAWDAALRDAILRSPNRRFRTFWTARGGHVDEAAQQVIDHRGARIVSIEDATEFLTGLADKVAALEESARPDPASVELAVAMVKRYLPDERDHIRLTDTVMEEARRLHTRVSDDERYPVNDVDVDVGIVHRYEADAETLIRQLAHLGAYGKRSEHSRLAARALELVINHPGIRSGLVAPLALRRYPALAAFYALGLAAVGAQNWEMLRAAAMEPRWNDREGAEPLICALHPYRVFENANDVAQALATGDPQGRRHTPHSDYLHDKLREALLLLLDSDAQYDETFDRFEYLVGVLVTHLGLKSRAEPGALWVPDPYVGRLRWRYGQYRTVPVAEWAKEHTGEVAPRLLTDEEDPVGAWSAACEAFEEHVAEARRRSR